MFWLIYIIIAFFIAAIIGCLIMKDYIHGREIQVSDLDLIDGEEWLLVMFGGVFWPITLIMFFFVYGIKFIFYAFFAGIIKGLHWIKKFNEKQSKKEHKQK